AVVADRRDVAALPALPHLRAAHAELAGESAELRRELERRASGVLIARQHVHEVDVPPVEAVHVIVEAEARIVVAELPIARCRDAVLHAAVMQHRQVEPAPVPRDELGRRALETVEETPEDFLLGLALRAEAE